MALTPSTMQLSLGAAAPAFALPDPDGKIHSLDDFAGRRALLVAFICNHCPYVKHVAPALAQLAKEYQQQGVGSLPSTPTTASTTPTIRRRR